MAVIQAVLQHSGENSGHGYCLSASTIGHNLHHVRQTRSVPKTCKVGNQTGGNVLKTVLLGTELCGQAKLHALVMVEGHQEGQRFEIRQRFHEKVESTS